MNLFRRFMSREARLRRGAVPRLLAIAAVCLAGGGPVTAPVSERKVANLLEEAEDHVASIRKLGPALVAVLADERQPARLRISCALRLGELRYAPAIPALIKAMELGDPDLPAFTSDLGGNPLEEHPCLRVLQSFGEVALLPLLEAYFAAPDVLREAMLSAARESRQSAPLLKAYLRDTMALRTTELQQRRANRLLGRLP